MNAQVEALAAHLIAAVNKAFARKEGDPIYLCNNSTEGWSVVSTTFAGLNARIVVTCANHDALSRCKEAFGTSHICCWIDHETVAMIPGI